jgi:hypothetical protein
VSCNQAKGVFISILDFGFWILDWAWGMGHGALGIGNFPQSSAFSPHSQALPGHDKIIGKTHSIS